MNGYLAHVRAQKRRHGYHGDAGQARQQFGASPLVPVGKPSLYVVDLIDRRIVGLRRTSRRSIIFAGHPDRRHLLG